MRNKHYHYGIITATENSEHSFNEYELDIDISDSDEVPQSNLKKIKRPSL